MDEIALVFDPLPSPDLVRLVEENVITHTILVTGTLEWSPVNYFLKSAHGDWVGGCLGILWGGYLHVRFLWITERLRGQGHGGRLLDAAEAHGVAHGATHATLDTFNPEALAFYRKRGFDVFATLADFPPGHAKYFLRKSLSLTAA